jgi:hypothetical protein
MTGFELKIHHQVYTVKKMTLEILLTLYILDDLLIQTSHTIQK